MTRAYIQKLANTRDTPARGEGRKRPHQSPFSSPASEGGANLKRRLAARLCRAVALPDNDAMHGCYLLMAGQAPAERIIDEVAL
jgi:hypothetical protein